MRGGLYLGCDLCQQVRELIFGEACIQEVLYPGFYRIVALSKISRLPSPSCSYRSFHLYDESVTGLSYYENHTKSVLNHKIEIYPLNHIWETILCNHSIPLINSIPTCCSFSTLCRLTCTSLFHVLSSIFSGMWSAVSSSFMEASKEAAAADAALEEEGRA